MPKTIQFDITQRIDTVTTANVFACGDDTSWKARDRIFFIAHYDHLGMMGKETMFPGASDNASGVAMLLELAKYFKEILPNVLLLLQHSAVKNSVCLEQKNSLESFVLWCSYYYIDGKVVTMIDPKDAPRLVINLDIVGGGDEGICVVNGKQCSEEYELLKKINAEKNLVPTVKMRGKACNSDHCPYVEKDIPAIYIYTMGGTTHYHDIYGTPESLPLTEFDDLFRLLVEFVEKL